jgi:hypothetical protein
MAERLFHVSGQPGITLFEPREAPETNPGRPEQPVVWAISEQLLHNYLLPRDCPRVTFYALPESDPADVERLMGQTVARYVVAVESRWLDAIRAATLYVYELPAPGFTLHDAGAGYHVSELATEPLAEQPVSDLLAALLARDVELRVTPSLLPLRDAVVASTLQFSCIRMRHARP